MSALEVVTVALAFANGLLFVFTLAMEARIRHRARQAGIPATSSAGRNSLGGDAK